jgi:hypothetical protein
MNKDSEEMMDGAELEQTTKLLVWKTQGGEPLSTE